MMDANTKISREIKIWMLEQGLTGAEVARRLNRSNALISQWIYGKSKSQDLDRFFRTMGMPENLIQREEV